MASVADSESFDVIGNEPVDQREEERKMMRISRFDIITSLFMALILFIGTFVLMLFIIWLLSGKPKPKPLAPLIENPAGRGENPEGFERDFEPPGAEEVEELQEPTLADTIEAVTDAVSTVAASLTTADTSQAATTTGTGKGDSRPPGPPGEGDDIIPRWERWELNFKASNQRAYGQQLDFYKIELGAFGGGLGGLDYASNLAASPQKRHTDTPDDDKRIYFSWKSQTPFIAYERNFLQRAGVQLPSGRNVVRLIPPDLENLLANIEKDYAESKGKVWPNQIAKTMFESKASGSGYAFEITSQRYRRGM